MSTKSIAFDISDFNKGMSGDEYAQLVQQLSSSNKTTGPNQNKDMVHYTQMNAKRMNRWNKTMKLNDDFTQSVSSINYSLNILVITEAWCGDAAHNIPFIQSMEGLSKHIKINYVLRDENTSIIDSYLTRGGLDQNQLN